MEGQLKAMVSKVDASKAALQAADPAIVSKAKMGSLQGAYEYQLGRYEQFRARYDAEARTVKEKRAKYNAQANQYNICIGAVQGA